MLGRFFQMFNDFKHIPKEQIFDFSFYLWVKLSSNLMERVTGIEPVSTAWKAVVIAVIRHPHCQKLFMLQKFN